MNVYVDEDRKMGMTGANNLVKTIEFVRVLPRGNFTMKEVARLSYEDGLTRNEKQTSLEKKEEASVWLGENASDPLQCSGVTTVIGFHENDPLVLAPRDTPVGLREAVGPGVSRRPGIQRQRNRCTGSLRARTFSPSAGQSPGAGTGRTRGYEPN